MGNHHKNLKKHFHKNKGKIAKNLAHKSMAFLMGEKMSHNKHIQKLQGLAKQGQAAYDKGKEIHKTVLDIKSKIPTSKEDLMKTVHGQARALYKNSDIVRNTKQFINNNTEMGIIPKHGFKRMFKKARTDVATNARKRRHDVIKNARSEINKRFRRI